MDVISTKRVQYRQDWHEGKGNSRQNKLLCTHLVKNVKTVSWWGYQLHIKIYPMKILNINFEILDDITNRVFVNLISWAS